MPEPSLSEVIRDALDARLVDVHTATIGQIVTYDPITQTANVRLVTKRALAREDGEIEHEEPPVLPSVPVSWPRAGGFFLHMPVLPGDSCLLVFCEDSNAMWRETGAAGMVPGDVRRHSYSSAVAIMGVAPSLSPLLDPPLPAMDPTEAVLGGGVYRVGAKATAVPVALAPLVDAFITAFNSHTHGTGVGPSTPPIVSHPGSTAATKLKAE